MTGKVSPKRLVVTASLSTILVAASVISTIALLRQPGYAQRQSFVDPALSDKSADQTAQDLAQRGKFVEAGRAYEAAVSHSVRPAPAVLTDAGWAYFDGQAYRDAVRVLTTALKRDPYYGNALSGLAVAAFEAGDAEAMESVLARLLGKKDAESNRAFLEQSMKAGQGSLEREWGLALLYTAPGSVNERAVAHLERVLQLSPQHQQALWRLGNLYGQLGRGRDAQKEWDLYLMKYPDAPEAYAIRSDRKAPVPALALQECLSGLAKFPGSFLLFAKAAAFCGRFGDPNEGFHSFAELHPLAEKSSDPRFLAILNSQLALYAVQRRRYPEAEAAYRELCKGDAMPSARLTLGQLLLVQGKAGAAVDALKRAQDAYQSDVQSGVQNVANCRVWSILALLASGKKEAAAVLLTTQGAVADQRFFPELGALADWVTEPAASRTGPRFQDGQEELLGLPPGPRKGTPYQPSLPDDALGSALDAILHQFPDCYPALLRRARTYAASGETQRAGRMLEQVVAQRPQWWAGHWVLALDYLEQHNIGSAQTQLKAAVNLAPALAGTGKYRAYQASLPAADEKS